MSLEPSLESGVIPIAHVSAIDSLLRRYGLELKEPISAVANSLNNDNYRAETQEGPRFIRIHRKSQSQEAAEAEQAIVAWVAKQGLPVVPALADGEGRTLHALSGVVMSVYPWVAGHQAAHDTRTPRAAHAMGAMHGRLHTVLARYPGGSFPRQEIGPTWDIEASIEELSRVDDLIRYYPSPGEERLRIQAGLREQLDLLESPGPRVRNDFAELPPQLVHGDYHDGNVLFDDDLTVTAVLDWEFAGPRPPMFEILRAFSLSEIFTRPLMDAYLAGYAGRNRLVREHCELAVELAWQALLHNTWDYHQRFIEGNRRVDPLNLIARIRRWSEPGFRRTLTETLLAHAE